MIPHNLYEPATLTLVGIREEAPGVQTFRLVFDSESERQRFYGHYRVGMFGLYGLPGEGESVFCVASPPTRTDHIECTFRRAGRVTGALQDLEPGQRITFRGPYGNAFPVDDWVGRNLLFIAGGIALPPVRSVIWNILDRRPEFGRVTIVYGARTPEDLVYKHELAEWDSRGDLQLVTTVDPGGSGGAWTGRVGFVPAVLEELAPDPENTVVVLCGPPVMIKRTVPVLSRLGFPDRDVYTTLENRMKCGVGHCGRCNAGEHYICTDGPVFTVEQFLALPQEDL